MKKSRIYYLVIGLITVLLFTTAAICNQCQMSRADGEDEILNEEESDSQGIDSDAGQGSDGGQTSGATDTEPGDQTDAEPEEPEDTEEPIDNTPPYISEIILIDEFGSSDIEANDYSIDVYVDDEYNFTVKAYDDDGDELTYSASCDAGTLSEVRIIDNNNAEFFWMAPAEPVTCNMIVEVSDLSGGSDTWEFEVFTDDAEMSVEWLDGGEPEPIGESLRGIGADAGLSGYIVGGDTVNIAGDSSGVPSIYVGDTATIEKAKAFLSFDISELAGKTVIDAWFTIRNTDISGDPNTLGSDLLLYTYNYGSSLDAGDFSAGGTRIDNFDARSGFIECSNSALAEQLQGSMDAGNHYFQLKLAYTNENGNEVSDGLIIYLSDVVLEVSYR